MSELSDWELMRLLDCSGSTRLGIEDQGFPKVMRKLAAKKLVEQKTKGYQITSEGKKYLRDNQHDVWMLTHTYPKNRKVFSEDIQDYDED